MRVFASIALASLCLLPMIGNAQPVPGFDATAEGPWSDVDRTTVTVPFAGVTLDGSVSSAEYGGFEGMNVNPGETAWVLGFQQDKTEWGGPDDASFTFYLAYDNDYLYVGVVALDDTVRSNDPPEAFWKDDAIEIIMDPSNSRFDYNTDTVPNPYGGHCYFNYEGVFSEWDEAAGAPRNRGTEEAPNIRWSAEVDWTYGEDGDIYGVGQETADGWTLEVKFSRRTLEDPTAGVMMEPGNVMAFNMGADDDDGADLAIQYFWANRLRAIGANPDDENWELLLEEEIENREFLDPDAEAAFWDIGINDNGRLSRAGAGEIVFGEATLIQDWSLQ